MTKEELKDLRIALKRAQREFEEGRSMVEMLGTLAIIGVLSVGGIAGYRYAMNRYKTNEILNEVNQRAVIATAQLALGKAPEDIHFTDFKNDMGFARFSNEILTIEGESNTFGIQVDNIEKDVCENLVALSDKNPEILGVQNDELIEITPDDCSDNKEQNSLGFIFGDMDGSASGRSCDAGYYLPMGLHGDIQRDTDLGAYHRCIDGEWKECVGAADCEFDGPCARDCIFFYDGSEGCIWDGSGNCNQVKLCPSGEKNGYLFDTDGFEGDIGGFYPIGGGSHDYQTFKCVDGQWRQCYDDSCESLEEPEVCPATWNGLPEGYPGQIYDGSDGTYKCINGTWMGCVDGSSCGLVTDGSSDFVCDGDGSCMEVAMCPGEFFTDYESGYHGQVVEVGGGFTKCVDGSWMGCMDGSSCSDLRDPEW